MASIIIPSRWQTQPTGPVEPRDPSWILISGGLNRIWPSYSAPTSAAIRSVCSQGLAITQGFTSVIPFPCRNVSIGTKDFTLFGFIEHSADETSAYAYAVGSFNGALAYAVKHNDYSQNAIAYFGGAGHNLGTPASSKGLHRFSIARRSGVVYYRYNNTTTSVAGAQSISDFDVLSLNSYTHGGSDSCVYANYLFVGLDDRRGWSDAEQAEFSSNPWGIYKPVRRPIFVSLPSGVITRRRIYIL